MSAVYKAVSDMSNACGTIWIKLGTSTFVLAALNGGLKIIGRHDKG